MYIMSYFTDSELCARLAKSEDLLSWSDISPCPAVKKTENTVIRDPFLIRDKAGVYRMLFTVGWRGNQLGLCDSADLKEFSPTRFITVMPENTVNVWAPECIYSPETDDYIVFWSSTVGNCEGYDHRIWCSHTKDFISFSKAEIFFDPDFSCIDATVFPYNGGYAMIFKDERGENKEDSIGKNLYLAFSEKAQGPFGGIKGPFSPRLVEGPCAVCKNGVYHIFFESFTKGRYNCFTTRDFAELEDISQSVKFPENCKHFSIIEV